MTTNEQEKISPWAAIPRGWRRDENLATNYADIIPQAAIFDNPPIFASPKQIVHLCNYQNTLGPARFNAALTLLGIDICDLHSLSESQADRLLKIIRFVLEC